MSGLLEPALECAVAGFVAILLLRADLRRPRCHPGDPGEDPEDPDRGCLGEDPDRGCLSAARPGPGFTASTRHRIASGPPGGGRRCSPRLLRGTTLDLRYGLAVVQSGPVHPESHRHPVGEHLPCPAQLFGHLTCFPGSIESSAVWTLVLNLIM